MLTRAKIGKSTYKVFLAHIEPHTTKQSLVNLEWYAAMKTKYESLLKNDTCTLSTLSPYRKPIGCKWMFKFKQNSGGSVNKYKERLVAKGFLQ